MRATQEICASQRHSSNGTVKLNANAVLWFKMLLLASLEPFTDDDHRVRKQPHQMMKSKPCQLPPSA